MRTNAHRPPPTRSPLRLPVGARAKQLKGARCSTNLVPELGEHFAGDFELLGFALGPLLCRFLQTVVSSGDVGGGCIGEAWAGQRRFKLALSFGEFRQEDRSWPPILLSTSWHSL